MISESLARDRWPNQDPIGHTIEFGNMDGDLRLLTIVGIVGDTHEYGLDVPPRPTVYVNLFQRPRAAITLTMLSDADTRSVTSAARGILQDLNPEIPAKFRTFSQVYSASLGSRRFNVILIGFFGITALLLATAGVFGVMAYSVSRRTREIGVRVALGAGSGDVLRMILGQGLRTILIGVAIGFAGSLALTRTWSVAALWRDCHRSADFRRGDTSPRWSSAAGLLHSGAASNESRPHGCIAVRVTTAVISYLGVRGPNVDAVGSSKPRTSTEELGLHRQARRKKRVFNRDEASRASTA